MPALSNAEWVQDLSGGVRIDLSGRHSRNHPRPADSDDTARDLIAKISPSRLKHHPVARFTVFGGGNGSPRTRVELESAYAANRPHTFLTNDQDFAVPTLR